MIRVLGALALLALAGQARAQCAALSPADSARGAVTEAIAATLRTAAHAAGVEAPTGLVVVMMDRDGGRPAFRLFDSNLPESAVAVAAPHVAGLAAAWPGAGRVRLIARLDPHPLPECRGRRRQTDPRFASPDDGRNRLRRLVSAHMSQRVGRDQIVLWVALSRTGQVAYAEAERGDGTLIPGEELRDVVHGLRMHPATLDRVPQDRLFSTPIQYAVGSEGTGPLRNAGRRW